MKLTCTKCKHKQKIETLNTNTEQCPICNNKQWHKSTHNNEEDL